MSERAQRKLVAIVAADIAGYSRLIGMDEEGTLRDLRAHRAELIDPLFSEHGGRIANTAGDSLLLEFASVVDAVRCVLAMQCGMAERNTEIDQDKQILFRVGINVGDVVAEGNDLLGDGVNIAARVESLAKPGGMAISDDAYRQVRDRLDISWSDGGEYEVKNIARPVKVWRWAPDEPHKDAVAEADEQPLSLPDKPSIAVLPFDNMSGDPEQEYFADGITEDIITSMSKVSSLFVIARNSTFTFKGKPVKVQDVGRDLGVRYVLEGSVRKAGSRVRVTAQLVDALNGQHLWAERYDRDLDDIFSLQDELSLKIVTSAAVRLSEQDSHRLMQRNTDNVDAYDHLLRGRDHLLRHTPEANALALDHFERAAALDPGYAAPYVHLAETHLQQMQLGWSPDPTDQLAHALECVKRAIAVDDEYAPAHGVLGQIYLWRKDYERAVIEGECRVALNPGDAEGIATLAMTLVFAGEPERALDAMARAMRLDPQYPFWHLHVVGLCHFALERYDDAIAAFQRCIVRNPDSMPPHMVLAAAAALVGDMQTATSELAESKRLNPDLSLTFVSEQIPYRRAEDIDRLVAGLKKAGLKE